jgi:hypothetical protein
LAQLQKNGLTEAAWEQVAKIYEIADIAWAAKRNGHSLRQTKAAQRRREVEALETMYKKGVDD